jgi:hypothetical protein
MFPEDLRFNLVRGLVQTGTPTKDTSQGVYTDEALLQDHTPFTGIHTISFDVEVSPSLISFWDCLHT